MWKLRRKKSVSETDERTLPAEKEFWLVRGAFAIAGQRRSARRENGPVRIGFTGSSMA